MVSLRRKLGRLALVAAIAAVACGVTSARALEKNGITTPFFRHSALLEVTTWPRDSTVDIRIEPRAVAQLDTIMAETRATHTEQAWCAISQALHRANGRTMITLRALERSQYVTRADSMHIWADRPLCDDGVPGLHSHILYAGGWLYFPSPTDSATAANRDTPYDLLLSVAGPGHLPRLTVYGLRAADGAPK